MFEQVKLCDDPGTVELNGAEFTAIQSEALINSMLNRRGMPIKATGKIQGAEDERQTGRHAKWD